MTFGFAIQMFLPLSLQLLLLFSTVPTPLEQLVMSRALITLTIAQVGKLLLILFGTSLLVRQTSPSIAVAYALLLLAMLAVKTTGVLTMIPSAAEVFQLVTTGLVGTVLILRVLLLISLSTLPPITHGSVLSRIALVPVATIWMAIFGDAKTLTVLAIFPLTLHLTISFATMSIVVTFWELWLELTRAVT